MMRPEQERVLRSMEDEKMARQTSRKLRWNPQKKTIESVYPGEPGRDTLDVDYDDMRHSWCMQRGRR